MPTEDDVQMAIPLYFYPIWMEGTSKTRLVIKPAVVYHCTYLPAMVSQCLVVMNYFKLVFLSLGSVGQGFSQSLL